VPEGHVVHIEARRFDQRIRGRVVHTTSPQERFGDGAAALDGRRLTRAEAYGKNLFLRFSVPRGAREERARAWLHVHLGLVGVWRWYDGREAQIERGQLRGAAGARQRLVMAAGRGDGAVAADLRGAMTCVLLDDAGMDHVIGRLGPDPVRDDADPQAGFAKVRRSSAPLGTLLLQQAVVAGAGLIWRCEAPFLAGIAPQRPGRDVAEREWLTLWDHLARIMRAAVDRGGSEVTTGPDDRPSRRGGVPREEAFYLFRRAGEACRVCGTMIQSEAMNGRAVWWCPTCQPH
jgi:formamidopyrimidine-DNA glycosylase